jgi:hypothetical protein
MPDPDEAGRDQQGADKGAAHLDELRAEQEAAAVHAIGNHSADEREEEDREAAEDLVESEQEFGVGEGIDQPALRDDLHERPDTGRAGADPHEAEVAILKRFEDPAEHGDGAAAKPRIVSVPGRGFC